ncbi:MAG: hypothetical protein KF712_12595 [Akkermansiaceae bacterium]|nr:hypothetical protein [Akkermansiaceae bacterium]
MNRWLIALVSVCLAVSAGAQIKRADRTSLLNSDPDVVYLEETLKDPIELEVIKEAPVFSDKTGSHRLGYLRANQRVKLEAITDKVYRVRGQGRSGGISGWVGPWAFASKDPAFVENLKKLYVRQIEVQNLIAAKAVAVGMTIDEVALSLGKPTKTSMRRTSTGEAGSWEFIDYEEVKHYVTRIDPVTGGVFRQLSHVTQEEKSKTAVEFENGLVTAVTESENRQGGNVRIIVPPLIFRW